MNNRFFLFVFIIVVLLVASIGLYFIDLKSKNNCDHQWVIKDKDKTKEHIYYLLECEECHVLKTMELK
jgi:hypothetical protein